MKILEHFRLDNEKEDYDSVIESISKNVVFKGTNLWVLVLAIFIASLGLNVNSTAVIIGAMLVSPLMGPIMGLGLGMAINDLALLKKALFNYLFSAAVALATSTVYFLLSPISETHSEILARTSPNLYDLLIALFGGLAGSLATASKQKGNVIPGVAIATALMPPLCTAGFGLATLQFSFFFGALYLFIINSVFIAFATLITARFLKFPHKVQALKAEENRVRRIFSVIVIMTFLPSIYFAYDIVQRNKFVKTANEFIENEADFPNDYLLKKTIDPKNKSIKLVFGGATISEQQIKELQSKLIKYRLESAKLEVKQGFAYLKEEKEEATQLSLALAEKDKQIESLQIVSDSFANALKIQQQIFKELKIQHPQIQSLSLQPSMNLSENSQSQVWLGAIHSKPALSPTDQNKIESWLKVRVNTNDLILHFSE